MGTTSGNKFTKLVHWKHFIAASTHEQYNHYWTTNLNYFWSDLLWMQPETSVKRLNRLNSTYDGTSMTLKPLPLNWILFSKPKKLLSNEQLSQKVPMIWLFSGYCSQRKKSTKSLKHVFQSNFYTTSICTFLIFSICTAWVHRRIICALKMLEKQQNRNETRTSETVNSTHIFPLQIHS